MNSKSYRIRTNVSQDQVVRAQLTQDVDFLEILSLRISQEDTYKLQTSNYGIVVGRVLANDAFGIPNAKVSVFVPLQDEDKMRSEITNLYPYSDIRTTDKDNRRYNLLPDSSTDECYRVVGTFPNKTLLLDNGTEIEVYEKYWKYTTVTNKSGDYMLFGVPVGSQQVHVDVDLSDIGVLSQKPRDFIYKGFNITQFDNANQFKESTNLDNLSQLLTQTSVVQVYPFFGDSNAGEIAISRCDLQVQYKFEPTCVFFGSIVSDNFSNNIGDKCNPSKYCGFNRNLVTGEGTIEMIRKTQDNLVEEFQIQGNRLIDGNGVWCYQIPMNLDYVGTDEFGNIVPTDNPKKGVPTRTSVRFRVSMQETNNEGISRHRAKYLIPNNVPFVNNSNVSGFQGPVIDGEKYTQCYEFGSATPDEYFRDLYWNKVYSVKNYIPRIQRNRRATNMKYSAIRTVNDSQGKNPFPFNNARFKLFFSYKLLCIIISIMIKIVGAINYVLTIWGAIAKSLKKLNFKVLGVKVRIGDLLASPFKGIQNMVCSAIKCIGFEGLTESTADVTFYPNCNATKCMKTKTTNTDPDDMLDTVQQLLAQEYDTVNLDFYNDWVNGCLYLPLWFWKKTKKRKFFFGLFKKRAKNRYCNCDTKQKRFYVVKGCALNYNGQYEMKTKTNEKNAHSLVAWVKPNHGIIKEVENNAGLKIYYYAPGIPMNDTYTEESASTYVVLYATDIILLGSLNECDLDNLPRPFINLPSTTANIPFISTLKEEFDDDTNVDEGTSEEKGSVLVSGMDWLGDINQGLFMDLRCTKVETRPKTCINLYRMSELGVTLDAAYDDVDTTKDDITYTNHRVTDGLITRYEIMDNETRAMIASLNHYGLTQKTFNRNTGYDTYKLGYVYPLDFDGHMSSFSYDQTKKLDVVAFDAVDTNYVDYRLGIMDWNHRHSYSYKENNSGVMPIYNNSFYFYFGLNEGNTAIDKFNNLFYAECYQNKTSPFTINYTVKPGKWCQSRKKNESGEYYEYGTIQISLFGIQTPYSYKVYYDYAQNPIFEENNVTITSLTFNQQFTYTNGDKVQILSSTTSEDGNIVDGLVDVLVENTTYRVVVTDNIGKTLTQKITLQPFNIDTTISAQPLGNDFLSNNNDKDGMCGEYASNITVDDILIDGASIALSDVVPLGEINDGVLGYTIYGTTQTLLRNNQASSALCVLEIQYLGWDELEKTKDYSIVYCLCGEWNETTNTVMYHKLIEENNNKTLKFNAWVPGNYQFTVRQFCQGNGYWWQKTLNIEGIDVEEYKDVSDGRTYYIQMVQPYSVPQDDMSDNQNNIYLNSIFVFYVDMKGIFHMDNMASIPVNAIEITSSFRCQTSDMGHIYYTKYVKSNITILSDNVEVEIVNVKNGEPFTVFLNNTPLDFINQDNTDKWECFTRVDDESFYNFNNGKWELYDSTGTLNKETVALWSTYTNLSLEDTYITNDNGKEEISGSDLDTVSKTNIITYKMNCLFDMCSSIYITHTSSNSLTLSTQGGAQPILYNGVYPDYSRFNPLVYNHNNKFKTILHDKEGAINCLPNTPNIVRGNYCEYMNAQYGQLVNRSKNNYEEYRPNPLFEEGGNFVAAFTSNGNGSIKFPTNATPLNFSVETSYTAATYSENCTNFFQSYFIDKRLDYSVVAQCYADTNLVVVSGCTHNGLCLRYDNEKNIISPTFEVDNEKYEYCYNPSTTEVKKCINSSKYGRFYAASTNLSPKSSLVDDFKENGNDVNVRSFVISGDTSDGYVYFSITNCDYPLGTIVDSDENDNFEIKAYVEEGENVEFEFQTENIFKSYSRRSFSEYVMNDIADVDYYVPTVNGQTLGWTVKTIKFRVDEDTINSTHNSFTTLPFVMYLEPSSIISDCSTPTAILTQLRKNGFGQELTWENLNGGVKDDDSYQLETSYYPISDWLVQSDDTTQVKYITDKDGLVYDNMALGGVVFNVDIDEKNTKTSLYLCAMRFYHNNEQNNLMRNISVLHCSPKIKGIVWGAMTKVTTQNKVSLALTLNVDSTELDSLEIDARVGNESEHITERVIKNEYDEQGILTPVFTFTLKPSVDYNGKSFVLFIKKDDLVHKFDCGKLSYEETKES